MRRHHLDHDMLGQQLPLVLRQDGGPFYHVSQLTNIAGPTVLQQLESGFRTQRQPVRTEAIKKTDGQGRQIFHPVLEQWQLDWKDGQPVIKVLTKLFFLNQLAQISVRCCHHPHVYFETVGTAQSLHFALFQKSQKLGLQAQRQIPDFVEEKRPALRCVNSPDSRLHRPGKRSFGVSE